MMAEKVALFGDLGTRARVLKVPISGATKVLVAVCSGLMRQFGPKIASQA
jgi:hypothetical protein